MATVFVDTNVWLRFLVDDSPAAGRARALIERAEDGEFRIEVNHVVITEIIWTLGRSYGVAKNDIAEWVRLLLDLPSLVVPEPALIRRAVDLFGQRNMDFADAYHAAYMHARRIETIASFDRDFDRLDGIRRIEP